MDAGVYLTRASIQSPLEDIAPDGPHRKSTTWINQGILAMCAHKRFSYEEAKQIGDTLGIDWGVFNVEQFQMGLDVELEHGTSDGQTNVTNDDALITGKIALAHLKEFPDYYTRLTEMEKVAREYWANG